MDTKTDETKLGQSYLTVAQAAEALGVHPSTIRRWIDSGRLRAFRLGPKRIAIRRPDLKGVMAPRRGRASDGVVQRKTPGRMTKAEQHRGLKALEELRRFQSEMAAKYGKLELESWVLINEARDEGR